MRNIQTVSIPTSGTTSSNVELGTDLLLALQTPAAWDAGDLTVEVSVDGVTYKSVVTDTLGIQVNKITALATVNSYVFAPQDLAAFKFFRLKSSVTQSAKRDFVVVTRPFA